MKKVTLKEFVSLADCSEQLVGVYVAKGMPKHKHPENKRMNLFDLSECRAWAFEKKLKSFEKKVDAALMKQCDLDLSGVDYYRKVQKINNGKNYRKLGNQGETPEHIKSDKGMPFKPILKRTIDLPEDNEPEFHHELENTMDEIWEVFKNFVNGAVRREIRYQKNQPEDIEDPNQLVKDFDKFVIRSRIMLQAATDSPELLTLTHGDPIAAIIPDFDLFVRKARAWMAEKGQSHKPE